MKYALIIDGVVDTIALERPGHFADEAYSEDVQTEREVTTEGQKTGEDGLPVFESDGETPVMETVTTTETVTETVERLRQVFVPDERFIECSDDVFGGYLYSKKKFSAPVPVLPPLASYKAEKTAAVVAYADSIGRRFTDHYPAAEVQSWPAKIAEARAALAGETDLKLLPYEAGVLGMPIADLAARIVAKGSRFEMASALIAGVRQRTSAMIEAAPDHAAVDAILAGAMADAEAKFADLK